MACEVPDFNEYRKRKQQQMDRELDTLLRTFQQWLVYHTNLREKVRAKHLFSEKTGCSLERIEQQPWHHYFTDWFMFDYITIIGTRLFDMFIKEQMKDLTRAQVQLSGVILTAALEPYTFVQTGENGVKAVSWANNETVYLTTLPSSSISLERMYPYFLTRSVWCGFENRLISPAVPLMMSNEAKEWSQAIKEKEEKHQRLRFMKEHGVMLLSYAEDVSRRD
ncbi:hypothetical protein SAMN05192534_1047 [Alteribacillus persepolensis]|uniref:Uncharacterized protein n=1 Tax=Alteribacillus persepolensis TaxID=568899 RepID=A0A1G8BD08_9BACI|nr:hypothetical protein [Alteribacillus persepolensis]SDH31068.1 hypothetical protein SAMN05192534_1047 [Alteribacillus persepolensis]